MILRSGDYNSLHCLGSTSVGVPGTVGHHSPPGGHVCGPFPEHPADHRQLSAAAGHYLYPDSSQVLREIPSTGQPSSLEKKMWEENADCLLLDCYDARHDMAGILPITA